MRNLYRRWRPLTLADVVGQEQVTKPLTNAVKTGRINHAYLFTGPRGTGKTTVARIFAHLINDFKYELEDDYVDIVEIDGASNRGVDNIREIREKAMIAPSLGKYKVYIIDEVHMLTKEAFNALLKTLEEPPAHVVFVMATTDAYKVPVTITSRSQTFTFKLATPAVILKHLEKVAKQEGIEIDEPALAMIAKKGGGSFRDSLSLLDQISTISDEKITLPLVEKTLGLPSAVLLQQILTAYLGGDISSITTILKNLLSTGVTAETLTEGLIAEIIESPTPDTVALIERLVEVKAPFAEARLLAALVLPLATPEAGAKATSAVRMSRTATAEAGAKAGGGAKAEAGATAGGGAKAVGEAKVGGGAKATTGREAPSNEGGREKFQRFIARRQQMKQAADAATGTNAAGTDVGSGMSATGAIGTDATGAGATKLENDELNLKISAIIGGKVENYGGGNPFEK